MKKTNRELIGEGLEILNKGMRPYVESTLKDVLGDNWEKIIGPKVSREMNVNLDDTQIILKIICDQWNNAFKTKLKSRERSLVFELRDARNRWAHMDNFTNEDTYRCLDSICRLLTAINAPESGDMEKLMTYIIHVMSEEKKVRTLLVNENWGEGDEELEDEWDESFHLSAMTEEHLFAVIDSLFDWIGLIVLKFEEGVVDERQARVLFRSFYMVFTDKGIFKLIKSMKWVPDKSVDTFDEYYKYFNEKTVREWFYKLVNLFNMELDWEQKRAILRAESAVSDVAYEMRFKEDNDNEDYETR